MREFFRKLGAATASLPSERSFNADADFLHQLNAPANARKNPYRYGRRVSAPKKRNDDGTGRDSPEPGAGPGA